MKKRPAMRIIGGKARGVRLTAPKGLETRPVLDSNRESVFNILQGEGLEKARVLDLFAGTGSLGLEALSRGAVHCVFVEHRPAAAAAVKKNLEKTGFLKESLLLEGDAFVAPEIEGIKGQCFDLIFADPPFRVLQPGAEREAFLALLETLLAGSFLSREGLLIVGHKTGLMDNVTLTSGTLYDRRRYGIREMSFFEKKISSPFPPN